MIFLCILGAYKYFSMLSLSIGVATNGSAIFSAGRVLNYLLNISIALFLCRELHCFRIHAWLEREILIKDMSVVTAFSALSLSLYLFFFFALCLYLYLHLWVCVWQVLGRAVCLPLEKLSLLGRHKHPHKQRCTDAAHSHSRSHYVASVECPCRTAHPLPQRQCNFNNSTNCVSRQKPLITFRVRAPANGWQRWMPAESFHFPTVHSAYVWYGSICCLLLLPSRVRCLLIIDSHCHWSD